MDVFCEQSVIPPRRQGGVFRLALTGVCCLCVAVSLVLVAMLARRFDVVTLVLLVVFGGGGFLAYRLRDSRDVEYDLLLVDDELRCDRVIGRTRRKPLFVAPAGSWESFGAFDANSAETKKADKVYMLAFGGDELSILVFRDKGRRCAAVWRPSEEMAKGLKRAGARVLR